GHYYTEPLLSGFRDSPAAQLCRANYNATANRSRALCTAIHGHTLLLFVGWQRLWPAVSNGSNLCNGIVVPLFFAYVNPRSPNWPCLQSEGLATRTGLLHYLSGGHGVGYRGRASDFWCEPG